MSGITIREAAQRTGLSVDTLRYYERAGLIDPVRRAPNGRRYEEVDLLWLAFLRRLRATGMPIAQVRRFARLRYAGDATAGERRELLEEHARIVRDRLAELSEDLAIVERKIAHFRGLEEASRSKPTMTPRKPRPGRASTDAGGECREGEMIIRRAGEGRQIAFRGASIVRKADAADTGGRWAFGEATQPPGFENSPHSHSEPEAFYVLDGDFVLYGSGEPAGPRSWVLRAHPTR